MHVEGYLEIHKYKLEQFKIESGFVCVSVFLIEGTKINPIK